MCENDCRAEYDFEQMRGGVRGKYFDPYRRGARLTAVFQKVDEGYVGYIEELPGANAQGATLEETRKDLEEAIDLIRETSEAITDRADVRLDQG